MKPRLTSTDERLLHDFGVWLNLSGYARATVRHRVEQARHYLAWRRQAGGSGASADLYLDWLSERPALTGGGGLASSSVNAHLATLKQWERYRQISAGEVGSASELAYLDVEESARRVLTRSEIASVYAATGDDALGLRDRAILGLYYGCGLRRNEGLALDVCDIDLRTGIVRVEQGKGGKDRETPLVGRSLVDVRKWLRSGRPQYTSARYSAERGVLLGCTGRRLGKSGVALRLAALGRAAGLAAPLAPHQLRHSIATHLLEAGMSLERIALFLGHESLESTVIYTHIAAEQNARV